MADRTRKRRPLWPWGMLFVVLLGVGVVMVRKSGAGPKAVDSSLIVTLARAPLEVEVIETGKVQPREKVEVKSKVPGQVTKVLVQAGDKVKRGQVLLTLDAVDFERNVKRAQADVAAAKNALAFAKLSFERRQKGLEARGVAQADVDAAAADVRARAAALQVSSVASDIAADQLRYTRILAPVDGTVTERNIQPGEVVVPGVQATFDGKSLLTVSDLSELLIKIELNQIDVAKVKLGQPVTVTFDALPGRTFEASVTKVAPASVVSKTVEVFPTEATLKVADPSIKPGMTADVRIHIEKRDGVLALPIEAVVKESGRHYVTRLLATPDGKPKSEKVAVEPGLRNDRQVEIVSGLHEGDRVMIKPASAADNEYKM